ncbi:MAG: response regulator [Actinomycetota bacterium]|nr:response regulator [Actinomycetota bacterium]
MGRVLVVDDDETLRVLLRAHLKQTGHRVLLAASAEEAISTVEEHGPPDVAVLDVTLPDSHGFELAQELRAAAGVEQLPIIFLSANVDDMHIEQGRELGAVYLTKPYIRTALCNAVDKALAQADGW